MEWRWIALSLACLTFTTPPRLAEAGTRRLTLEEASGRGGRVSFGGQAPQWSWSSDGRTLIDRSSTGAKHIDPVTMQPVEADADRPADDEAMQRALVAASSGLSDKAAQDALRRPIAQSADRGTRLVRVNAERFLVDNSKAVAVTGTEDGELITVAPRGFAVAFVRGNDLYVWTATGGVVAITTDGSDDRLNGKLDWVYQEEVYGRGSFTAYWWSPDGQHIAFLSLDESPVHDFTVIDHIEPGTFRVKPEVTAYPLAGDPNPVASLAVHSLASGSTRPVDLTRYQAQEPLIVRVAFAPSGELLFVVSDRIQTWADLNACDPQTLAWTTWIHETNDSWVDRPEEPRFLADGSYLWLSDRTDQRHIYRYRNGELLGAVTSGDWSVVDIDAVDETSNLLWFRSTKDGAINSNLYRCSLDGRDLKRLTRDDGTHSVRFNHDRSLFLDSWSSLSDPPRVRLCDGDGRVLHELGTATIKALDEYQVARWELVEIETRDGFVLDAAILRPTPQTGTRRHPVWIPTYSGPDAPTLRNRWDGSAFNQFLAQQGFIVMQVNVRTASGKGHGAIEHCYKQLGRQELADLEDAVDWIATRPWADGKRVGIGGYSYGGFMAAFALTHSRHFALGIAGGGVFDWGMYDTIYTERYMSTPQRNAEGYQASSVIAAAKDLSGHLLIHHGVMDDNVHVQNSMQLVYALQKAGRTNFELMLYPQARHGVGDPDQSWHLRQLEWNTMRRVLGGSRIPL